MTDFIIIGGGVVGLLTAYELNRAGAKVTVLERSSIGTESSWAGGGILSPLYPWRYNEPVNALAHWSQQHYALFCQMLFNETGIDPEWNQNGLLMLDNDEQEIALKWAKHHHSHLEKLHTSEISHCEPQTKPSDHALWMPDIAQVRNPRLLQSLKAYLPQNNVTLKEHCDVKELLITNGSISGVRTKDEQINADNVIIASGAWSPELLKPLNTALQVKPVRGQMLLFKTPPKFISRIVMHQGHYVIPRRDGHTLVGSTIEHVGFEKETTQQAREELHKSALNIIPALANYPIKMHWAGLRPGSPDGIPFIGQHPTTQGLYINAGHYRNGVILGPASAHLLADIALKRTPIVNPEPYALNQ